MTKRNWLLGIALGLAVSVAWPVMADAHPNTVGSRPMGGNGTPHHHHFNGNWGWGWWYWPGWDYQASAAADALAWQQWNNESMLQAQNSVIRRQQAEITRLRKGQDAVEQPKAKLKAAPMQPRPPAPQAEVVPPEQRAAAKFKLAMVLADNGKTADAAEFCNDIIRKYPGTPATEQAQTFLNNLNSAKTTVSR
jgi:hypothetical protein